MSKCALARACVCVCMCVCVCVCVCASSSPVYRHTLFSHFVYMFVRHFANVRVHEWFRVADSSAVADSMLCVYGCVCVCVCV